MKKVLFLFVASVLMLGNLMAQNANYQRSSLCLLRLTSEDPITDDPALEEFVENAWKNYPFPDKYNNHIVEVNETKVAASDNTLMAWIKRINSGNVPTELAELKQAKDALTGGKAYRTELKTQTDEFIKREDIARKLVMKWFNIQKDGSANTELLLERSAFNMSSSDVATAASTARGAKGIADQFAEEMLNTTFVAFSMMNFYNSEPIAAALKEITIQLAPDNEMAKKAAIAGAEKLYEATKNGYTAMSTTLLYQLVWNDSIQAEFYKTWNGEKIDMDKFNALTFEMKFLGDDNCTSVLMKFGASQENAISTVSVRNLNKQFANLQKQYEVFRPVAPIICTNPLMADMGTKEGLKGGEKFEILTRIQDPKTGKLAYKSIGKVKVDKNGVWDNNYNMVDNKAEVAPSPTQSPEGKNGTVLSSNKKAMVGMVVRQIK